MTPNALYEDFKTGPVQGRDGVLVGGNTDTSAPPRAWWTLGLQHAHKSTVNS